MKNEKPIMMKMSDTHRLFKDVIRSRCLKSGLNMTYLPILMLLSHNEKINQLNIVNYTHLKAPTISLTLTKMEMEGLITREVDSNDQRNINVSLTKKGIELDYKLKSIFSDEEEKIKDILNDEERENLNNYLDRIVEYLVSIK